MRCRISLSRFAALIAVLALTSSAFSSTAGSAAKANVPPTPANFWNLPGPQAVVPMPFQVVDPNPSSVQLRFTDPPLEYSPVTLGGVSYTSVVMSGEASTVHQGEPDLPRVNKMIMVNRTGEVGVTVTNSHYTVIENVQVAPKQPYEGEDMESALDDLGYALDPAIYGQDIWYPQDLADISAPATLRDVRFVALAVAPVQYNPARRELRVYDEIELVIEDIGGIGDNEITVNPAYISPSFKKLYRTFENFQGSALDALPELPGKYLIICPNNTDNTTEAQRLVDWHRRKGLDASYVTLATTGTLESNIRTYISNQYTASNGTLEFVCLFGDAAAASTFTIPTETGGQYDNYYGTISSGGNPDPVPDLAVGRISITSATELNQVVTKSITYESNPYTGDMGWFTRGHCTAHTSGIASNPWMKEYVRQIMLQNGTTVPAVQIVSSDITYTEINNIVDNLISVFNHRLSYIGQIDPSDLASIPATGGSSTVGGAFPLVYVMTCGTGDFTGVGQDTSEEWLIPPTSTASAPRGAIGAVGLLGTGTHVPFNNILDAGAMYGLYVLDIPEQGIINIAGKLELYRNYAVSNMGDVQNFSYWANLMGDPGVRIWHKQPSTTSVSHVATAQRGTNHLSVTVTNPLAQNVQGALVCVLKGTETFARGYTNSSGQIDLPVSTPTTGTLLVTVTKDDQLPYLGSVTITTPTANLVLNSVAIDDDDLGSTHGNNDDIFNPGETIDLSINLLNNGTTNLTNVSGTLVSQSAGVSVSSGFRTYGTINAGATGNPATPYQVSVANVFNNEPVTLFLNLTADQGSFVVRLDFTPVAPDVTYLNQIFGGPGGNLDPGESGSLSVTMQNSGSRQMVGADAILRSLDDRVTVTDSIGYYGNVNAGVSTNNAGNPFAISISSAMFNGHTSPMQLVVYDDNGFRDSTNFALTIGSMSSTSPSGPDAFGYYAFDNTESQPASAATTYSWVEINAVGTNLNMTDTAEDDDDTQVHTLPFTFRYHGNDFTQMTICSNGWAAFGSYPEIRDFRNYRMGSPIGPPNQLAAYWDDLKVSGTNNVFKWHNTTDHFFVIEWRAQTLWTNYFEIFQVILYDPTYYPSASGNGKIKYQYNTVTLDANSALNDNPYASVGIQNQDHSVAVDYYFGMAGASAYGPGAATIQNGRAIMFTTDDTGSLAPTVSVGAPNGGETLYLGQATNITWSSTLIPGNVSIELNRAFTPGPGAWETIIASTPNDGTHPWTLSGAVSTSSRIRVRSVTTPTVGDTSNANFTIATPTVTVTYPNGGELLAPGNYVDLTWSDLGLGVATVELNRTYPSGTWELISNGAAASYSWLVTAPSTSTARIRVTGNAWPAATDVSNANFKIGIAPVISHLQKSDQSPGAAIFVATLVEDNPGTVIFNLYYRTVGGGAFTSVAFVPTGNPGEFSATIPGLVAGEYEYYLDCVDTEGLSDRLPDSGQITFDVDAPCTAWIGYDDGTAENYNWVNGHDYEWAVRFNPGNYPFSLCAAEYAVNPSNPTECKAPVEVKVYLADGPSGMPGTLVLSEVTGTVNAAGGLPSGAAWTPALFSTVVLGAPFYVSVENTEPRECPVAFGLDTGTNSGNSYYYDWCEGAWFSENYVAENSRPGNRMIRISGYSLQAPTVVVRRSGNDVKLHWTNTSAPFYKVYSATTEAGPFSTFEGSTADTFFLDTGVVPTDLQRFYQVQSSATP